MSIYSDSLAEQVVNSAKSYLPDTENPLLEVEHVLLGALSLTEGRALLSRLMTSELIHHPETIHQELSQRLQKNRKHTGGEIEISQELKSVIAQIMKDSGGVDSKSLLQKSLEQLRSNATWQQIFFTPIGNHPSKEKTPSTILRKIQQKTEIVKQLLGSKVLGQHIAIDAVSNGYFRKLLKEKSNKSSNDGPALLMTFIGPPGVGKTFLASCFADHLSSLDEQADLLRIDMSEYADHQSHERLTGFNPAYRGASEGSLAGFVAKKPMATLLIDEIEKAHINTRNLFLQILDAGHLYDNHLKKKIDFSQTTIIFTTNLGSELYSSTHRSGFLKESAMMNDALLDALTDHGKITSEGRPRKLSPELVSRLGKGEVVLFNALDGHALEEMTKMTFNQEFTHLYQATGLQLTPPDPLLYTLLSMRFGHRREGRELVTGVTRYIGDLTRELGYCLSSSQSNRYRVQFRPLEWSKLPEEVVNHYNRARNILVIDDAPWSTEQCRLPGNIILHTAGNIAGADQMLRNNRIDVILLDLHIDVSDQSSEMSEGLAILRWTRKVWGSIPVLLFSELHDARGLPKETLESVANAGGAYSIINKPFSQREAGSNSEIQENFRGQLLNHLDAIHRQRLVEKYHQKLSVIDFETRIHLPAEQADEIHIELDSIRNRQLVNASDRGGIGWVEMPTTRFSDIAGAGHAKQRLLEIAKGINKPEELDAMGVTLSRGILLSGPPGTGKTMLARAIAGETGLPFFSIGATEVIDKYVGESEAKLRDLFQRTRRYAPAILFIDEIDSIGGSRELNSHSGNTLINELLTQLDGFSEKQEPIFVLAATNRPELLDSALTRPGRFDQTIEVPLPDSPARRTLFESSLDKLATEKSIDYRSLVARTMGMSGAEIAEVCNEAARISWRDSRKQLTTNDLHEAITNIRMGLASEHPIVDEALRWSTAVHEAGHAITSLKLFPERPLAQLTILPRGSAMGFAEYEISEEQAQQMTDENIRKQVQVTLSGRVAEEILLGESQISAGCENDLERASQLALSRITRWGMDRESGIINLHGAESSTPGITSSHADIHLNRANQWMEEVKAETLSLLTKEKSSLEAIAKKLLEHETLYGSDPLLHNL
jgi:cell division protease FtsH